jgi:hypothetical protein
MHAAMYRQEIAATWSRPLPHGGEKHAAKTTAGYRSSVALHRFYDRDNLFGRDRFTPALGVTVYHTSVRGEPHDAVLHPFAGGAGKEHDIAAPQRL